MGMCNSLGDEAAKQAEGCCRGHERAVSLRGVDAGAGAARAVSQGVQGILWAMLYLASRSPRRADLLRRLGVQFSVLDLDVIEHRDACEQAQAYVRRVAREKAGAGLLQVMSSPGAVVLGADTEVILGEEVFGKPADAAAATAMLSRLSGRVHQVVSAVSLVSADREAQVLSVSEVEFAEIGADDIAAYVASGECMGKAGAYAIQGAAEQYVKHLAGSFSGVMGLPLHETAQLLRTFGIR